jgi:small subunit ribosomal protein S17
MADEEKNDQTEETPQDDANGSAAGPVAEDGPPADTPEDASSTPPADYTDGESEEPAAEEASEDEGSDAPAEEPAAEEADAPAAEPGEDLPWKERRRLLRSREPAEARPQRSPEERAAERAGTRKANAAARRRFRQGRRQDAPAGTGTPPAERHPNAAKMRQGVVVSDKPDKTIIVRIDIARRHPTYEKIVRRSRTLHAHDERNEAGEGDIVRVIETRPLSRSKRWRLVEVIEKAR